MADDAWDTPWPKFAGPEVNLLEAAPPFVLFALGRSLAAAGLARF